MLLNHSQHWTWGPIIVAFVEIELYEEIDESAKEFSTPSGSPVVN